MSNLTNLTLQSAHPTQALNMCSLGTTMSLRFALNPRCEGQLVSYEEALALIRIVSRKRHEFAARKFAEMVRLIVKIYDLYPEIELDHKLHDVLNRIVLTKTNNNITKIDDNIIFMATICNNIAASDLINLCKTESQIKILLDTKKFTHEEVLNILTCEKSTLDDLSKIRLVMSALKITKFSYTHTYMSIGAKLLKYLNITSSHYAQPIKLLINLCILNKKLENITVDRGTIRDSSQYTGENLCRDSDVLRQKICQLW